MTRFNNFFKSYPLDKRGAFRKPDIVLRVATHLPLVKKLMEGKPCMTRREVTRDLIEGSLINKARNFTFLSVGGFILTKGK